MATALNVNVGPSFYFTFFFSFLSAELDGAHHYFRFFIKFFLSWIGSPETGVIHVPVHARTGMYCPFDTVSGSTTILGLNTIFNP